MVLTELRKIYKVSMQELADEIVVSKQLIGQIEKGNRGISLVISKMLAHYFGIMELIKGDPRDFFTKESLSEIELLEVKKAKIEKEKKIIIKEHTVELKLGKNSEDYEFVEIPVYDDPEMQEIDDKIEKAKIINRITEVFFGDSDVCKYNKATLDAFLNFYEKAPIDGHYVMSNLIEAVSHYYKILPDWVTIHYRDKLTEVIEEVLKKNLDK